MILLTVVSLSAKPELVIDIADEQSVLTVDPEPIRLAVTRVLNEAQIERAQLSVALVDDRTIHELNRRYLCHDCATDVLSFILERSPEHLDGQIVVSTETARNEAARYGWSPDDELLLYVIHGALHLVGFDDQQASDSDRMREKEREILAHFGRYPCYDETKVNSSPNLEEAM